MSRISRLVGLFVFVALTAVALAQSQQPPPSQAPVQQTPTFKAQVEYVEVDALVTDQQGQFVRNLTKDDFQVFEDGKRQTISTFSLVDIPIERYDRPLFSPRRTATSTVLGSYRTSQMSAPPDGALPVPMSRRPFERPTEGRPA